MEASIWGLLRKFGHQKWSISLVLPFVLPYSKNFAGLCSRYRLRFLLVVDSFPYLGDSRARLYLVKKSPEGTLTDEVRVFQRGLPHSGRLHPFCLLGVDDRPQCSLLDRLRHYWPGALPSARQHTIDLLRKQQDLLYQHQAQANQTQVPCEAQGFEEASG